MVNAGAKQYILVLCIINIYQLYTNIINVMRYEN